MPSCLRANCVAPVLPASRISRHALSLHGLQPIKSTVPQWHMFRFYSFRQTGKLRGLSQVCSDSSKLYAACRKLQGHLFLDTPTKHTRRRQQVVASVALHGAPGILIGLGALFAGVALAAFLLAAIPTLVVGTAFQHGAQLQLDCSLRHNYFTLVCRV